MTAKKDHTTTLLKDGDGTAAACNAALAETYKALKAIAFYPENHPLREKILQRAYQTMVNLMKDGGVSLIVHRNGLSLADQEVVIDNTAVIQALAKELFAREVQRLTLLPELSLGDFAGFLSVLAIEPHKVISEGGFAGILANRGIQTVISDEIDISAVFTKKRLGEATDDTVAEGTVVQEDHEQDTSLSEGNLPDHLNNLKIEELLALMSRETGDNRYRQLARILLGKGASLKVEGDFDRLFPILLGLLNQNADATMSTVRRDCSLMVFKQLALGEMAEHLFGHLEDKDFVQHEVVYHILNQLGGEVVDAVIRRFVDIDNQFARKSLATALLRIGPPAAPPLIEMLKDGRWLVVRTAAAILGEMGSRDAVRGLTLTAHHIDIRVRMETVRSLAKIGGKEATTVLLELLRDNNQAIRKQAITWLGNTRNQKALRPLIQLVRQRDVLGKTLDLKKEALVAIGRIGDREALDPLFRLVKKRHWIVPGRHEELQVIAVETIGRLGGESSRAFLEKISARGGRIGRACSDALETMGQRTANSHE